MQNHLLYFLFSEAQTKQSSVVVDSAHRLNAMSNAVNEMGEVPAAAANLLANIFKKDKTVIKKDEIDSRAPNIKPITAYFKENFKESLARKGYRRQIGWTLLGMV